MKKTIALLTMAAAGVALAGAVESAATFGVLKVASSTKETVICVPWVAAGTGEAVLVKDLVKTSNLTGSSTVTDADRLLLYTPSTGKYKGWYLNSSKVWTGTNISYNNINAEGGTDEDELERGDALILIRQNVSDTAIYLYGQYKGTPVTDYEMAYHASVDKATLFAPVPVGSIGEGIYLNNDNSLVAGDKYLTWANVGSADQIAIQDESGNAVSLYWNGEKWGVYNPFPLDNPKGWQDDFIIQPGMGAWYYAAAVDRTGNPIDRSGAPTATLHTKE